MGDRLRPRPAVLGAAAVAALLLLTASGCGGSGDQSPSRPAPPPSGEAAADPAVGTSTAKVGGTAGEPDGGSAPSAPGEAAGKGAKAGVTKPGGDPAPPAGLPKYFAEILTKTGGKGGESDLGNYRGPGAQQLRRLESRLGSDEGGASKPGGPISRITERLLNQLGTR